MFLNLATPHSLLGPLAVFLALSVGCLADFSGTQKDLAKNQSIQENFQKGVKRWESVFAIYPEGNSTLKPDGSNWRELELCLYLSEIELGPLQQPSEGMDQVLEKHKELTLFVPKELEAFAEDIETLGLPSVPAHIFFETMQAVTKQVLKEKLDSRMITAKDKVRIERNMTLLSKAALVLAPGGIAVILPLILEALALTNPVGIAGGIIVGAGLVAAGGWRISHLDRFVLPRLAQPHFNALRQLSNDLGRFMAKNQQPEDEARIHLQVDSVVYGTHRRSAARLSPESMKALLQIANSGRGRLLAAELNKAVEFDDDSLRHVDLKGIFTEVMKRTATVLYTEKVPYSDWLQERMVDPELPSCNSSFALEYVKRDDTMLYEKIIHDLYTAGE